MGRRFFRLPAAFSLSLAIVLLALIVRGTSFCDEVAFSRHGTELAIGSVDGYFYFQSVRWACNPKSSGTAFYSGRIDSSQGGPAIRAYYAAEDDGPTKTARE